jgi:exodeoxyribonuclease-3
MIISTFNINSINARLKILLDWLEKNSPDVVFLQELKCDFNSFPFFEINSMGYDVKILAQKSYNGVAILSRYKIKNIQEGLPGIEDENARYIEADIDFKDKTLKVASVYLPNGNPPYNNLNDTSKFEYKLKFMDALYAHAKEILLKHERVVLGGDFNVILSPDDVYNPELFINNALYKSSVKQRLRALLYLGYYDAFRVLHPKEIGYTYWDYAQRAYEQDWGLRIDYLLLSPKMADSLKSCYVDKTIRVADKPSDHTPLTAEFEL